MPISLSCPACGHANQLARERGAALVCAGCGLEFASEESQPTATPETEPAAASSAMQSTRVMDWNARQPVAAPAPEPPPPPPEETSPPESPSAQKGIFLADYELLKKLGEGAMGIVYRARQSSLDREVAIKVLFKHVARNPRSVERFYREAKIMAKLDHPGIVRGYAVGEDQGWHYFAMELVRGSSVQRLLQRLGKLTIGDALYITIEVAKALQYAHDRDLVHRDIKPDNVLITHQGVVKVSDLGMAKLLDEEMSLTQTGYGVGTPCYMPLEQARNSKEVDGRCDIYALGCMLYCMLVGQPPFTGTTFVELVQAKEAGTFRPARRTNPEVPERLDLIIHKMVAKQPRDRYASCADVVRDLEALGLASKALSFLGQQSEVATKVASSDKLKTPIPESPAPAREKVAEDVWYLRYTNRIGQVVTRKMTTADVLALIQDDDFDLTAKASRTERGGYRALSTFKEFESIMLPRVTRAGADLKQRGGYKKLVDELGGKSKDQPSNKDKAPGSKERPPSSASRPAAVPKQGEASVNWVGLLVAFLAVGLGGGLVYFLLTLFVRRG